MAIIEGDIEQANAETIPVPAPSDNLELYLSDQVQIMDEEKTNRQIMGGVKRFVLAWALSFSMIYLGAKNFRNCPICNIIPIYLLVQGIITPIIHMMCSCQCGTKELDPGTTDRKSKVKRIFYTASAIWFIFGSIFVYIIYEPNYNSAAGPYCDKTTYKFAFWFTNAVLALGALFIIICGMMGLYTVWKVFTYKD